MSFRSEPMQLCQLIMQKDTAYTCVVELGQHALVQFKDLNYRVGLFQRTYVREMRRYTELERCIRYIEQEVVDGGATDHIPPIDITNTTVANQREMLELESRLYDLERDIRQFLRNEAQILRNYNDLQQCKSVYEKVEAFFNVHIENTARSELETREEEDAVNAVNDVGTQLTPLLTDEERLDAKARGETPWFIAGTIDTQKQHSFERVLWRACRRTAFVRTAEIEEPFEDPDTGKFTRKSVFIIFFNGRRLQDIIYRVCDGFSAKEYTCPKTSKERQLALADLLIRLHDLSLVIERTEKHKLELLRGAAFELPGWLRQVHLQKCIFNTLNLFTFDTSGQFFIAECWVWERKMDAALECLQLGADKAGGTIRPIINPLETGEVRPTHNRVNKYIEVFQHIVDSYGVATYGEINPAPYTIITFPFLFAVMFGDIGHGLLLLLAGLSFIRYETRIERLRVKDEIFNTFFAGRFIIVLMGLFSMYAGFMYNDAFSKSLNVFGTSWRSYLNFTEDSPEAQSTSARGGASSLSKSSILIELDPARAFNKSRGPYWAGVDPVWNLAENKLEFVNSMKMKLAVLLGIAQMVFGVVLGLLNAKYFRDKPRLYSQELPKLIFLTAIFVYLCALIVVKWVWIWVEPKELFGSYYYPGSHCAPTLLVGLINMFMLRPRREGFVNPANHSEEYPTCHLSLWYPHQSRVELALVTVAVLCVPVMLMGRPLTRWLTSSQVDVSEVARRKASTRKLNKSKNLNVRLKMDSEQQVEVLIEEPRGNTSKLSRGNTRKKDTTPTGVINVNQRNGSPLDQAALMVEEEMKMFDLVVEQAIHALEFVLGCISHTASYLRLWALSLAHAQLSEVLWHMLLAPSLSIDGPLAPLIIFAAVFAYSLMTFSILVLMEGLSAFLHTLRLHWVEFQSKFYEGGGYPFVAFSLSNSLKKLASESDYY